MEVEMKSIPVCEHMELMRIKAMHEECAELLGCEQPFVMRAIRDLQKEIKYLKQDLKASIDPDAPVGFNLEH